MQSKIFAFTGAALLCAASLPAQQSAEEQGAPRELSGQSFPGLMGTSGGRLDSSFNPAIGLILDMLYVGGGEGLVEGANGVELRSAELDIASRIDPLGWAYAVAAFEEDEFELEEAALVMDQWLPGNFSLRAGRYLADFGKWNTLHLHGKNYVFEDGVRESVFGGNLRVEGLELHHWTGLGDVPLRWSLGAATGFGGHGHGDEEHDHGGFSQFDEDRSNTQWGWTGRVTAQHDVGQNGYFQWGGSFFHTPEGLLGEADTDADGEPDLFAGLEQTTVALDLTLRVVDAAGQRADTASVELWYTDRQALEEGTGAVADREAPGVWGFYQHDFNPWWGAGVMGAWWQEPSEAVDAAWFSADTAGAMRAAFVTWNMSDFNRLRLQVTQHLPEEAPTAWSVALQWDVILGAHSHPLDF